MSIDPHLVRVIADFAILLEFSGPAELDEDVAIKAMDQLASELQLMSPAAKASLCRQFMTIAESCRDAERRAFVEQLPDALGLT